MKKIIIVLLTMGLLTPFSFAGGAYAGETYLLLGREIFPGIDADGITQGALFVGKVFTYDQATEEVGYFSVSLDHNGENIETCMGSTAIYGFTLILNFNSKSRLVLTGPTTPAAATWYWDDPNCEGGCPFASTGFEYYLNYLDTLADNAYSPNCGAAGDQSLIAGIPAFGLAKQIFGSYGPISRATQGGMINGWLIHTPTLIPAVIGTVTLN